VHSPNYFGLLLPLLLLVLTDDKERVVRRKRHDFDFRRHGVTNVTYRTDIRREPRFDFPVFSACRRNSVKLAVPVNVEQQQWTDEITLKIKIKSASSL